MSTLLPIYFSLLSAGDVQALLCFLFILSLSVLPTSLRYEHAFNYYLMFLHFPQVMCKLYYFAQCLSYTASIVILTIISAERYLAIIHPIWSKRFSRMLIMRVVVLAAWGLSVAYSLPLLLSYDLITTHRLVTQCRQTYGKTITVRLFCLLKREKR